MRYPHVAVVSGEVDFKMRCQRRLTMGCVGTLSMLTSRYRFLLQRAYGCLPMALYSSEYPATAVPRCKLHFTLLGRLGVTFFLWWSSGARESCPKWFVEAALHETRVSGKEWIARFHVHGSLARVVKPFPGLLLKAA